MHIKKKFFFFFQNNTFYNISIPQLFIPYLINDEYFRKNREFNIPTSSRDFRQNVIQNARKCRWNRVADFMNCQSCIPGEEERSDRRKNDEKLIFHREIYSFLGDGNKTDESYRSTRWLLRQNRRRDPTAKESSWERNNWLWTGNEKKQGKFAVELMRRTLRIFLSLSPFATLIAIINFK